MAFEQLVAEAAAKKEKKKKGKDKDSKHSHGHGAGTAADDETLHNTTGDTQGWAREKDTGAPDLPKR